MPAALGDRLSTQPPMPSGGLYPMRAPPALTMPPKYGFRDALKDVVAPAGAGALVGPVGAVAGLLYGLDTAAGKYRMSRDPLAQMQYAQAYAQAQYGAQNPDIDYRIAQARQGASVGSDQQLIQFLEDRGYRYGTPDFDQAWQKLKRQAPTVYGAPVQDADGNWMVPPKVAGVAPRVLGAGPNSQEGFENRARGEGQIAAATQGQGAAAEIRARTSPQAIAGQADLAAATGAAGERGELNEQNYDLLNNLQSSLYSTDSILAQIEKDLESGVQTGLTAPLRGKIDSSLQVFRSSTAAQTLENIRAAKAAGIAAPNAIKELEFIESIGVDWTNQPDANLEIIRRARQKVRKQIGTTTRKLATFPELGAAERPAAAGPKKTAQDYLNAE